MIRRWEIGDGRWGLFVNVNVKVNVKVNESLDVGCAVGTDDGLVEAVPRFR